MEQSHVFTRTRSLLPSSNCWIEKTPYKDRRRAIVSWQTPWSRSQDLLQTQKAMALRTMQLEHEWRLSTPTLPFQEARRHGLSFVRTSIVSLILFDFNHLLVLIFHAHYQRLGCTTKIVLMRDGRPVLQRRCFGISKNIEVLLLGVVVNLLLRGTHDNLCCVCVFVLCRISKQSWGFSFPIAFHAVCTSKEKTQLPEWACDLFFLLFLVSCFFFGRFTTHATHRPLDLRTCRNTDSYVYGISLIYFG